MESHRRGPWKPAGEIRAPVRAAGKALESDDRQTHVLSIIVRYNLVLITTTNLNTCVKHLLAS